MTRFVIGVGNLSLNGGDVERAVLDQFPGSEVNPVPEIPYKQSHLYDLYKRVVHFAERMRNDMGEPADYYAGVASGLVKVTIAKTSFTGWARVDVAAILAVDGQVKDTSCLNPSDVQWQIQKRVYALASCEESVSRLLLLLHKSCKVRSVPKA